MATNNYLEGPGGVPAVRFSRATRTKLPVVLSGTSATLSVGGTMAVTGVATFTAAPVFSGGLGSSGALTVTSTSASALTVGRQGATDPVLKIDASTASVATGISITGAAAAGGVNVAAISSGTNENLTVNAKGSGTITLGNTSTGNVNSVRKLGVMSATTLPAGGTTGQGIQLFTTTNFGIFGGSGAPTLSAAQGAIYLRSDGSSTSTRAYINTDGGTTWTAITTAA